MSIESIVLPASTRQIQTPRRPLRFGLTELTFRAQHTSNYLCKNILHPSAVQSPLLPVQSHHQPHHKATEMRHTARRTKKINPAIFPRAFRRYKYTSPKMSTDQCHQTSPLSRRFRRRPRQASNTCETHQNLSLQT